MKTAAYRAPNVLVCMLGSGTLLAPPSLKTATLGNWGYIVRSPRGFGGEKAGKGGATSGRSGTGPG